MQMLRHFAGDKDHCWPSLRTLAELMGRSVGYVRRIAAEVASLGYIVIERRRSGHGGLTSNLYKLSRRFLESFAVGRRGVKPVKPGDKKAAPVHAGEPPCAPCENRTRLRESDSEIEKKAPARRISEETQKILDALPFARRGRAPTASRFEQADHNCVTYVVREWTGPRQAAALEVLNDLACPRRKALLIEIQREITATGWRLPSMEVA